MVFWNHVRIPVRRKLGFLDRSKKIIQRPGTLVKAVSGLDSAAINIRSSQDMGVLPGQVLDLVDRATGPWVKEVQPTFSPGSTHLQPH